MDQRIQGIVQPVPVVVVLVRLVVVHLVVIKRVLMVV
jgi:hypothetical protein